MPSFSVCEVVGREKERVSKTGIWVYAKRKETIGRMHEVHPAGFRRYCNGKNKTDYTR